MFLKLDQKVMPFKKESFEGQKAIVLPMSVIENIQQNPLINSLYITDIGFYPSAKFHFLERNKGISPREYGKKKKG